MRYDYDALWRNYNYERRYFTLDDVRHDIALFPNSEGVFVAQFNALTMQEFMADVIKNCGWQAPTAAWKNSFSNYLDICWQEYIWPKFYDKAICYTDDENVADDDSEKVFSNFIGPIIAWMSSSDAKFSILIKNQEDNKTKLLEQIKSQSVQRYNDTPQNQGEYDDNAHNTTTTKTEAYSDGGTVLSRLNEIEDNLKRLYENWSNEFRRFIIWSAE